jgi:DNA polymerase bacteriophage-type
MIHLDYETYSPLDLTEVGVFRYAEDPEAEILMCAVASETEGPFLLVNPKWESVRASDPEARRILEFAIPTEPVAGEEIWAHNAQFEFAISNALLEKQLDVWAPQIEQWRCTALLCRRAGFPAKLEKACELPQQKDARGKALIRKFSMPDPKTGKRTLPTDDPEGFREFGEYCLQDVRAEMALHKALKAFAPTGDLLRAFTWDLKVNARGFKVDVPALRNAQEIIESIEAESGAEFLKMTGVAHTQREKARQWFIAHGLDLPDMQAATLGAVDLGKAPVEAGNALSLYSTMQFAAVKKVKTMLNCVCADGRVRGGLQFHGASTGRWSGRLVQPQNFAKPKKHHRKYTEGFFASLQMGFDRTALETLYGDCYGLISSSIRHFVAGPLFDADYSAIEARIWAWLSGQENLLEEFRGEGKFYEWIASMMFGVPKDSIGEESYERQGGKVGGLGCGYQMGAKSLKTFAATIGVELTEEQSVDIVKRFRKVCDKLVILWDQIDYAIRNAIANPGNEYRAGKHLSYRVKTVGGIPYLLCRLPSGRNLAYPYPKMEPNPYRKGELSPSFFGNIKGEAWGRVFMFPGLALENADQGIAFDLMAFGGMNAEAAGYPVTNLVHDQALADRVPGLSIEGFSEALTILPDWAKGLPLTAKGKITPYYTK